MTQVLTQMSLDNGRSTPQTRHGRSQIKACGLLRLTITRQYRPEHAETQSPQVTLSKPMEVLRPRPMLMNGLRKYSARTMNEQATLTPQFQTGWVKDPNSVLFLRLIVIIDMALIGLTLVSIIGKIAVHKGRIAE